MALQFLTQIPQWMLQQLRTTQQRRELHRQIRRASKTIEQMPDWQKKDLNIQASDLRSYRHHM